MGLMSAIPGLSAHKTAVPPPVAVPFDRTRAVQLLKDGISLINSFYPTGSMEWLREQRPDVIRYLKTDYKTIEQAIEQGDLTSVTAAVEVCIKHHRKAFELYEGRPPVIEVQGALL